MKAMTHCPACLSWVEIFSPSDPGLIPWHPGRFGIWCNGKEPSRRHASKENR